MQLSATGRRAFESLLRGIGLAEAPKPSPTTHERPPLKWYFATNEAGTSGVQGLHARLMVASALQNTRLRPHMITTGFRNELTEWMEARGVVVIDAAQPLSDAIHAAAATGGYHTQYLGHWLRCEIPLIEHEDEFALYTDTDVVFLKDVVMPDVAPEFFAAAPEFKKETGDYVNTGVMVMNVPNMRKALPGFLAYAEEQIGKLRGQVYHDQDAYNHYFRGKWTPLDPRYNWKPYWGDPAEASILHFHGAKLGSVNMIFEQPLPYHEIYWRQIGSLVARFPDGYVKAIRATLAATASQALPERPWIEAIAHHLEAGPPPVPAEAIDLGFLDNHMF